MKSGDAHFGNGALTFNEYQIVAVQAEEPMTAKGEAPLFGLLR